jgi:signal transduction histidine kinase
MRRRIVALATLAAVLAIVLFGVPLAGLVARYLRDDERQELERVADTAAVASSIALARGQRPGAMPDSENDTGLALYDTTGRRLSGTGPPLADGPTRKALTGEQSSAENSAEIVLALPIAGDGPALGAIRATTPLDEVAQRVGQAWLLMAVLGAVAVLMVFLVARSLAARLVRPLEQLATAARALGQGDFSTRAHPAGINEIDAVGTALNSTATRLDELITRERAFSADASHQLRTPLTGLRLGLEVALESSEEDLRAAITAAIGDTERLHQTIEDLLALARDSPRAGDPLDLAPLLAEMGGTWSPRLITVGRELRIAEQATAAPRALASGAAVRQVLSVLLENAAVHGRGAVTVRTRDVGDALAIDVSDEGDGITAPIAGLFLRRSSGDPGHGIGLALARALAEAEGGRLNLTHPAPPTFTLLVPTADDQHAVGLIGTRP